MGLFSKKDSCAICGGPGKAKLQDGYICGDCFKLCSNDLMLGSKTVLDIEKHIEYRNENKVKFHNFKETDGNNYIKIDDVNKQWYLVDKKNPNPDVFSYNDVINYELNIDGKTVTKRGLGSAVVGGALLGGVGAIVGGGLGKKNKELVNSMYIQISLNHPWVSSRKISFITTETKKGGFVYNVSKDVAEKTVALFDRMTSQANQTNPVVNVASASSGADEILKFKNLLDAGVISQEEFDTKKKQLLGL